MRKSNRSSWRESVRIDAIGLVVDGLERLVVSSSITRVNESFLQTVEDHLVTGAILRNKPSINSIYPLQPPQLLISFNVVDFRRQMEPWISVWLANQVALTPD